MFQRLLTGACGLFLTIYLLYKRCSAWTLQERAPDYTKTALGFLETLDYTAYYSFYLIHCWLYPPLVYLGGCRKQRSTIVIHLLEYIWYINLILSQSDHSDYFRSFFLPLTSLLKIYILIESHGLKNIFV